MKLAAWAFIVLGLVGIIWGGITYTRSEKVVDIGPIEIRKEKKSSIPIPPLIGLAGLGAGIFLLARDRA